MVNDDGVMREGTVVDVNHPEHLVLVVNAADVVNDMQEAYGRITLPRPGYGVFISGPSKTADIEQSLVIGAHGARSCAVFVVG